MESESAASSRKAKSGQLFPILASAGILLAGNGLLVTLVAVRAGLESFPDSLIGLMGSIYFVGFMAGCLVVPRLIRRAGHIRTFASLAAVAAIRRDDGALGEFLLRAAAAFALAERWGGRARGSRYTD